MKTLIMVRHAQSGNHSVTNKDIDRTLDPRGRIDASEMAQILLKNKIAPDLFLSSPAHRAMETALYFLKAFGIGNEELQINSSLYEPTVSGIYSAIESISNDCSSAIVFTHNPGITAFINDLSGQFPYSMPACGMFAVNLNTNDWSEIRFTKPRFLFFEYPGKLSE